ncbi:uncharacterized protein LOC100573151 [Acyrthosiphon pisum]|uniref:Uncharacterized protein n=1 Tax=Acyrthosiphon pisum TaxID=7029 RepID=A0A8R2JMM5_ACYPI|nr:uncharacterized protein LOC100573151 [Acyrthosiphon pisum]
MEVFQFNFLRLMTIFKYNLYFNCAKICRCPKVQSIATGRRVATKKHFWSALGIIMVLFDINCLRLLVPKLNVLSNGVYFNLSDYYVPMGIYDIFKLILSILFLHFYLKYFMYRVSYKKF